MPNFKDPVKFAFKVIDTKVSNDLVDPNLYHVQIAFQYGDKYKIDNTTITARTEAERDRCIEHLKSKVKLKGEL